MERETMDGKMHQHQGNAEIKVHVITILTSESLFIIAFGLY